LLEAVRQWKDTLQKVALLTLDEMRQRIRVLPLK
jgi:hypothetical protein